MNSDEGGLGPPAESNESQRISMETQEANKPVEGNRTQEGSQGKVQPIDFDNKYKPTDNGPFAVYVEHKDRNFGKLFPIRIGHYLKINSQFKSSIVDIKSVGINRVKVILGSYKAANLLVNNEVLTAQGFISYIPKFYTQRKGVVRMIDTFFSEEYLMQEIECEREVVEVKRMKKWGVDRVSGEKKLIDRQMIILSFSGASLPMSIRINGVNFPVEPYIYPVVQCLRCLRYGHIAKQCKSTKSFCKKCSGEHEDNTVCLSDSDFCKFCNTDQHSPVSKLCPHYQKQKRIKKIMSDNNISFKEAEAFEKNPSYAKIVTNNRFEVLADMNNFPPLRQVENNRQGTTYIQNTKTYTNTPRRPQHSQGGMRIQPQQNRQNTSHKRRAPSLSPPPNAKKGSGTSSSVLPNPHRSELLNSKDRLSSQITVFINNLIKQILPENSNTEVIIEQLKIEDTIQQYFSRIGNDISNDNVNDTSEEEY